MSEWLQPVLTFAVAVAGSSALSAAVTYYFTRPKTAAEARKALSEADRTDAGTATDLMEEIRATAKDVRELIGINAECMREKASEEVKRIKAEAEAERAQRIAEGYRQDVVRQENIIAELNGQIQRLQNG